MKVAAARLGPLFAELCSCLTKAPKLEPAACTRQDGRMPRIVDLKASDRRVKRLGLSSPLGVNLKNVWTDIPPVRHWKFKSKGRRANALSTKILDRVVEVSTCPGDIVCDPFGGSGTTYAVCQRRGRRWIGIELDHCPEIVRRLNDRSVEHHRNNDIVDVATWTVAAD